MSLDRVTTAVREQSQELGEGVASHLNPNTGEVENVEVLFFSTQLLRSELFELPICIGQPVSPARFVKLHL